MSQKAAKTEDAQVLMNIDSIFRTAFESSPNAIILSNHQGKIVLVNSRAESTFGYSASELLGKPVEILVPKHLQRKHSDLREDFSKEPANRELGAGRDLVAMRKDGAEFPAEIGLSYIKTDDGVFVLATVTDITARKSAEEGRKRLEEKIQQTQKLESLGVLAGGIAHDFNNLLTGMLGNADLALLEISPVSPARMSLENIQQAALRAADLCHQMLAYSGKGKFVVEPLDINEVVTEMTHLLQLSTSKNAVIKYNLDPHLPSVKADATQIRQVVMNLVTNASEAIGDKSGVITITTGFMECDSDYLRETVSDADVAEGAYVYIEVADTGCGMTPEQMDKIFDPFFTTKFTGRGLGLAALLGIVRSHKGAVKIYSEPGQGTTFKIILPGSDEAPAQTADANENLQTWHDSGKVLVVDDDESVRAVARRTLERAGFTVLTAPDGRDALELLHGEQDIRLMVLDLTMPHVSGDEVLKRVRREHKNLPVIMTSGYNEQELVSRFAGRGMAGFVQKPLRPQVLLREVRRVLTSLG